MPRDKGFNGVTTSSRGLSEFNITTQNKYGEKMRELVNRDEVASQVSAHNVAPLSKIFVQERNFRVFKVCCDPI